MSALKVRSARKLIQNERRVFFRSLLGGDLANAERSHPDLLNIIISSVGTPMIPSSLHKDFHRVLALVVLSRIRFHDLRHTAAALMLNNGVPGFKPLVVYIQVVFTISIHNSSDFPLFQIAN
jgi:integrase